MARIRATVPECSDLMEQGRQHREQKTQAGLPRPRLSRRSVLVILIVALLALSIATAALFREWYVVDVKAVPIEVTVTSGTLIGFNTGTDKLYFGTTGPGGISERKATVVTSYDSVVDISVRGQVDGWVSVSENPFRARPNERRDIIFRLRVPESATPGNYTGTALIRYKRALPWQ